MPRARWYTERMAEGHDASTVGHDGRSCESWVDPVTEAYKDGIDRTLVRENLALTVEERFQKFASFMELVAELRRAGVRRRGPAGSR